jgi:hypothetical protein
MAPLSRLIPIALVLALVGCGTGSTNPAPRSEPERESAPIEAAGDDDAGIARANAVADAPVEPPALPEVTLVDPRWFDLAAATADRESLAPGYERRRYQPPEGSYVLAARIVDGVEQPAFAYLSRGDDGFVNSDQNFWPASAIKLIAAVGALTTLRSHGLTGDARLDFEDHKGRWNKRAERLYCAALTWSSNLAYDRLIRVAGFDEINRDFLTEERGFRYAAFQRAYAAGDDGPSLRESPEIEFVEGDREGVIPARTGTYEVEGCPYGDNCFSLFELLDPLSRVVLHEELPADARFEVAPIDIRRLKAFLTQSKCGFTESAEQVFGDGARIYNKRGYSPSFDMIDHALIVDEKTGRRYLLAASVRYVDRDKERAKAELAELGRHTLALLARHRPDGPLLQRDAGVAIEVHADALSCEELSVSLSVADDAVDRLELHRGRDPVGSSDGPHLDVGIPLFYDREIFVVHAYSGDQLVGYRAVSLSP